MTREERKELGTMTVLELLTLADMQSDVCDCQTWCDCARTPTHLVTMQGLKLYPEMAKIILKETANGLADLGYCKRLN